MKKIFTALSCLVFLLTAAYTATVSAEGTNLIANPSFETSSNTSVPDQWTSNSWGTNTSKFTYLNTGRTGAKSVKSEITSYSSGDAKWSFSPVTVKPSTSYTFTDWYQSSVVSGIDVVVTTTSNTTSYIWLANPAISSTWKQANYTFTTPANASKVTVYHYIEGIGQLTIDDASLAETNGTTTPNPPTTPSAPTVSITAPIANAALTGSVAVTANASDSAGIQNVQFKLDGTNLATADTTSPYSINWDTTTTTNGQHTLAAIVTNTSGVTAASANVVVNVNNTVVTPPTTPPPTTPGNLVPNPSLETANGSSPASWLNGAWGTNTRSMTYENTGYTGSKSVKAQITKYTNGDAKWYFNPVAVTGGKSYSFSNYYKSNVDTELDAMITLSNGTVQWVYLTTVAASPNTWQKATATFTVPADAKTVSVFQVLAKVGYVQTDDYSLSEYVPAQFNRAIVSLTFDDGWRSIYTNGLPLLKKYNLPSTQYLLTGTTTYPDYMTTAMMQEFKNQGSEIASHTVSHAHLNSLSSSQLTTELTSSQNTLRSWFGTSGVANNFATPYGEYNTNVVNEIKKYYRSHRSTDVGFNSKDSFNVYNIKVQNITNTTTPAQVQTWVNQAIAQKTWLVLVYHEVTASAADPTYAVTPTNLDQELNIIKQSGVSVQTVDQALNELLAQL